MKKDFELKYLIVSFIFLELVFKFFNSYNIIDISSFFVCLCSLMFAVFVCFIINFFKRKVKNVVIAVLLFLAGLYFSAHTCLYKFYKFYFQFSSLALLDQVAGFASDGLKVVLSNITSILSYFIPFILFAVFFRRFTVDKKQNYKLSIIMISICLLFYLPFAIDDYGYVNKAFASNNMVQVISKNGVLSSFCYDIVNSIKGEQSSINTDEEIIEDDIDDDVEYGYNALDIDFEALNEHTNNKSVQELNNYFASKTPTKKNEYTSMFEGKNLIIFMAESFNGIAINEDLTPTLYKLAHSGFEFTNFYTPTNYSTIGGEFTELTSLFPDLGPLPNVLSIFRSDTNTYPMGIGNLFKEEGYTTYAYHNSSYNFQDRDTYLHNLGFDNYNACWIGLEDIMNCNTWPASDVEMIDVTFDDYINEDKFVTFYASVSGHGPYVFDSENDAIAPKYQEMLEEYYGDSLGTGSAAQMLMAYEAGQIELDRALELLINKLEAAGKLEDTVIALVGDHHPYYITNELTMDEYNRLSTYQRDPYIELYHSNFILYNSEMETVTVDKVAGQLDVLPTIYNLFGLEYDSRLLMGTDILSSSSCIAIMSDNSWVNDYGKYYATTNTFEASDDMMLGDSYVSMINNKVYNIQNISILMMKNNYYEFVYKYK